MLLCSLFPASQISSFHCMLAVYRLNV